MSISDADAKFLDVDEFGQGSGTIYMKGVTCTGSELRLIDCDYNTHTSDCYHDDDAAIRCVPCKFIVYNHLQWHATDATLPVH